MCGVFDWIWMILCFEGDMVFGIMYFGGIWGVLIVKIKLLDFFGCIGVFNDIDVEDIYLFGLIEDV